MKKLFSSLYGYLKKSDTLLLILCLVSSIYGVVLISSAVRYTGSNGSVYVQIGAIVLGVILYILFSVIDVDIIASKWKLLTVIGLALLLSLHWLGSEEYGNRAWIRFGGIGIQPAELVKIIFIVSLAHVIIQFKDRGKLDHPLSVLLMGALFLAHFGLIVLISSDLGSALVYLFIFVIMLFAAGLKIYWFLGAAVAIAAVSPYIWNHLLTGTQKDRIIAPYFPDLVDSTGQGVTWQTNQSKMALASGRIFGTGLYKGTQTQSGSIPFQRTDFIFSVAGEELGIIGCSLIIILLTAIIIRCVYVGLRSQSRLGALVCFGIAAMITFQTFENIGMCIGVAPVIGLTLPFFSYGGSSIVTTFAAMGIVSGVKMKPKPTMFLRW
ncbi:MAG: FtsW/RodA/SpoVE family cell cycle protein [Oscillospiraceae bacterium]